jgi:hypothetical protein
LEQPFLKRRSPHQIFRIVKYGSTFIDTPYMQLCTKYNKKISRKIFYAAIYENRNEIKAELKIIKIH